MNEQIVASQVYLIMPDGRSAGNVSIDQAKYLASQYELDLVLINVNATPPIAKILDYNKFRYQQEKQTRGGKKVGQLKEVRLSYRIDPHDLETKANRARKFLEEGHLVRVFIKLRGRENLFLAQAKTGLEKFLDLCGGQWEQSITQVDKRIQAVIKPKK
ncbi:MAG: translation initiation factor IF-3 [Patescibacteria group bacterium]